MIHLALQTEYTFQRCYGHLEKIVQQAKDRQDWALGIADKNNSFGHVKFNKLCKSAGIKPIFGVRLNATDKDIKARSKYQTYNSVCEFVFLAKNNEGLEEIYRLINTAHDQYYYFPRLTYQQVAEVSPDVFVIAPRLPRGGAFLARRIDYRAVSPGNLGYPTGSPESLLKAPAVALITNEFSAVSDRGVYELLSSPRNTERRTYPQHILSTDELIGEDVPAEALSATDQVAMLCNASIGRASMLHYAGRQDIRDESIKGAWYRHIDMDSPAYRERFEHELKLIEEKDFADYFMIVADMIKQAKQRMLVGPARGSSAGSLICYLLGITEVDPIEHDLLFERFIDINRTDLPDIDTDFSDTKRQSVIRYLAKKYGQDNVRPLGTISTLKGRSALVDFAKALDIPAYEIDAIKEILIERREGDARFNRCIQDTFETTDAGKKLIEQFPELKHTEKIEGHSKFAGKHAAGVIVSNEPLWKYGGIDSKEDVVMLDGKDAESVGLLKIDVLGLRTLSILEETAKLAGFDYHDFYSLALDDQKVFDIMNTRMSGIFQFEGQALQSLTKQMQIKSFNDICALTALARPGALQSGGAALYIAANNGEREPVYFDDTHRKITQDTYSTIVYQEQMMAVAREIAGFDWSDVIKLRKISAKSLGDEAFGKFQDQFVQGCIENKNYTKDQANRLWRDIVASGSYAFNKSHSVSYSIISYWTAWCKAYYPLEFAAANLNHTKDDPSAIRLLRDFVINDNIQYIPVDSDHSDVKWTIKDGQLLGGLTNIDGIGVKKAQEIISKRNGARNFTPGIVEKLIDPATPFDILFPTKHFFGKIFSNPKRFNAEGIKEIKDIEGIGEYLLIGKLVSKEIKDRNSYQAVSKRGHEVEEDRFYLNLYVEDDTDSIKCTIPPFLYEDLNGPKIAETAEIDKTWFAIRGSIRDEAWRNISIKQISKLNPTEFI